MKNLLVYFVTLAFIFFGVPGLWNCFSKIHIPEGFQLTVFIITLLAVMTWVLRAPKMPE